MKIFYFLQHFLLGKRRSNVNLLQSSKLFAAFVLKTEFTEWACLCVSTNASVSVSRCAVAIEIAGGQHDNKHAACHLFISTYLHIYISTHIYTSTHPAADTRISRLSTYRHSVHSVTGLPVKQLKTQDDN